jgi:probable HAF family extracellular repeat protein
MTPITWLRTVIRKHGNAGILLALICLPALWALLSLNSRCRGRLRGNRSDYEPLLWGAFGSVFLLSSLTVTGYVSQHLTPVAPPTPIHLTSYYSIVDLGTLPNGGGSYALDINDLGQVVGTADTKYRDEEGDPIYHAFLWQNGVLQDIGTLGACSRAMSINARGQIVGTSWVNSGECYAFLWQSGKMRSLGSLGGTHRSSWAGGINEAGQVVGATSVAGRQSWYPFLWQDGRMQLLAPAHDQGPGDAVRINNTGDVIGIVFDNTAIRSYLMRQGRLIGIPQMGGPFLWAEGLNDRGQVVGMGEIDQAETARAFLWNPGLSRPVDLGTLGGKRSYAAGINNEGDVVGEAENSGNTFCATLWRDGKIIDLNSLLPAGSDWTLFYATAINRAGQIVGVGKHNGVTRGFLLTKSR